MPFTISEIIVLFFTYSVVGWLWETFYCSIKDHHFGYRGFLFGPYCPVYGFAVTTILVAAYDVQHNLILLFLVGIIVATIFEYVASLFLEKVFHMKLWDYSHLWGNLQGRVAPQISLFWGIGVVLLVRFIQPAIQRVINWEEAHTHGMLALLVVLVMGTDTILTIISIHHFHTTTQQWEQRAVAYQEKLKQRLDKALPAERPALARRLVKSFPKLRVLDAKHFNELKQDLLKKE